MWFVGAWEKKGRSRLEEKLRCLSRFGETEERCGQFGSRKHHKLPDWSTLWGVSAAPSQTTTIMCTPYTHYRITAHNHNTWLVLHTIDTRTHTPPTACTPSTAFYDGRHKTECAALFDETPHAESCFATQPERSPYLVFSYDQPLALTSYALATSDACGPSYAPTQWALEGRNSNALPWTLVDAHAQTQWTRHVSERTLACAAPSATPSLGWSVDLAVSVESVTASRMLVVRSTVLSAASDAACSGVVPRAVGGTGPCSAEYVWSVSSFNPVDSGGGNSSFIDLRAARLTRPGSHVLALRGGSLTVRETYTIELRITQGPALRAASMIEVALSQPPTGGVLLVHAPTSEGLITFGTVVLMTASNFTADELPLTFVFGYRWASGGISGDYLALTPSPQSSPSFATASLPVGEGLILIAEAIDAAGHLGEATVSTTVAPPLMSADETLQLAWDALTNGTKGVGAAGASQITSLLNAMEAGADAASRLISRYLDADSAHAANRSTSALAAGWLGAPVVHLTSDLMLVEFEWRVNTTVSSFQLARHEKMLSSLLGTVPHVSQSGGAVVATATVAGAEMANAMAAEPLNASAEEWNAASSELGAAIVHETRVQLAPSAASLVYNASVTAGGASTGTGTGAGDGMASARSVRERVAIELGVPLAHVSVERSPDGADDWFVTVRSSGGVAEADSNVFVEEAARVRGVLIREIELAMPVDSGAQELARSAAALADVSSLPSQLRMPSVARLIDVCLEIERRTTGAGGRVDGYTLRSLLRALDSAMEWLVQERASESVNATAASQLDLLGMKLVSLIIQLAHGLRHDIILGPRAVSSEHMELGANQAYAGEYHQCDGEGGAQLGPECNLCVYASDAAVCTHLVARNDSLRTDAIISAAIVAFVRAPVWARLAGEERRRLETADERATRTATAAANASAADDGGHLAPTFVSAVVRSSLRTDVSPVPIDLPLHGGTTYQLPRVLPASEGERLACVALDFERVQWHNSSCRHDSSSSDDTHVWCICSDASLTVAAVRTLPEPIAAPPAVTIGSIETPMRPTNSLALAVAVATIDILALALLAASSLLGGRSRRRWKYIVGDSSPLPSHIAPRHANSHHCARRFIERLARSLRTPMASWGLATAAVIALLHLILATHVYAAVGCGSPVAFALLQLISPLSGCALYHLSEAMLRLRCNSRSPRSTARVQLPIPPPIETRRRRSSAASAIEGVIASALNGARRRSSVSSTHWKSVRSELISLKGNVQSVASSTFRRTQRRPSAPPPKLPKTEALISFRLSSAGGDSTRSQRGSPSLGRFPTLLSSSPPLRAPPSMIAPPPSILPPPLLYPAPSLPSPPASTPSPSLPPSPPPSSLPPLLSSSPPPTSQLVRFPTLQPASTFHHRLPQSLPPAVSLQPVTRLSSRRFALSGTNRISARRSEPRISAQRLLTGLAHTGLALTLNVYALRLSALVEPCVGVEGAASGALATLVQWALVEPLVVSVRSAVTARRDVSRGSRRGLRWFSRAEAVHPECRS